MEKSFKYRWLDAIRSPCGPKSAMTRLCLINLGLHAKDDGSCCFPTYDTQAVETGCDKSTIKRNLKIAEADGWIKRKPRKPKGQAWRNYQYILLVPKKVGAECPQVSKVGAESTHVDEKVGALSAEGGGAEYQNVGAECPLNSPVKYPINTHSRAREENQKNQFGETTGFLGFEKQNEYGEQIGSFKQIENDARRAKGIKDLIQ